MVLFVEKPNYSMKKTVRINKFSKLAGYKNLHTTSVVCVYTDNKLSEREIKKTIPFIIASKRIKYLGTNLTKVVKDL